MIDFAFTNTKPTGALSEGRLEPTSIGNFSDGSAVAFLLDELCYAVRSGRLVSPIRAWLDER